MISDLIVSYPACACPAGVQAVPKCDRRKLEGTGHVGTCMLRLQSPNDLTKFVPSP